MAGDYSVQQLIENYNLLMDRSCPELAKAYAVGINGAAELQDTKFPWDNPQYFKIESKQHTDVLESHTHETYKNSLGRLFFV